MVWMPHRFRPPKKSDDEKWEVVKYLVEHEFKYHHIYEDNLDNNPKFPISVIYPQTLREAKEFVEKFKKNPKGEIL